MLQEALKCASCVGDSVRFALLEQADISILTIDFVDFDDPILAGRGLVLTPRLPTQFHSLFLVRPALVFDFGGTLAALEPGQGCPAGHFISIMYFSWRSLLTVHSNYKRFKGTGKSREALV
ncbi:MAG: hypothetical protein KTR32_12660 [Granulosicoccus sp.]|nr:hypothetical protein [Granulosicoccus sp.]